MLTTAIPDNGLSYVVAYAVGSAIAARAEPLVCIRSVRQYSPSYQYNTLYRLLSSDIFVN